ncbi:MAG: bifunctional DNA primase/polymerase [Verrucomicrobiae bacterium]|nr:bifunctional DNA primase/polymerase [Verrucomicrobiae bacterium]
MVPIPGNRSDEGSESEKGKKPKLKGSRKKAAKDIDADLRQKYWGGEKPANVALVLQGIHVVIDLDSKGDDGQTAEEWLQKHPDLAKIPRERTAGGIHLHARCPDLPEFTNRSGKPLGRALVSELEDGLTAELMFLGLLVTVAPSTHKSGKRYRWERGGELPEISWKGIQKTFGFRGPSAGYGESECKGKNEGIQEVQRKFRGDLRTLDCVELFRRTGSYGDEINADEGKHSVRCPFVEEHSDRGEDWTSADTSTVIYKGSQKLPGFHCLHAHCDGRGIADVLLEVESNHPGLIDDCCEKLLRPQIELPRIGRPQSTFANDVADVLAKTGENFLFGGQVVEVRTQRESSAKAVKLHPLEPKETVTAFEKHIEFVKSVEVEKGEFELVPDSMTKPEILLVSYPLLDKLPVIERLLPQPVPLFDGTRIVVPKAGYDARFRTFVDPNAPQPEQMSLAEALNVLEDLVGNEDGRGFAWKDEESKVAAISRLLTPYCRGLMGWKKAPVFLIMANQPRVGKDTLAYVVIVLYTGVEPTSPPLGKENDDEMKKRILSSLRTGARFIHFANMKGKIDFPSLEAATDASCTWRDRLLGTNKELVLPNEAEYSLSANIGAEWSVDLDGRAVIIRLHYSGEDVNRREFRHSDILGHVRQNRSRILGSMDALVRNWDEKGRPAGPTPHASFPEWAKVVGGIMHAAGLGDPCLRAQDLQGVTGDSETEDMRRLFQIGHVRHGNIFIGKAQLYELIQSNDNSPFEYLELETQSGRTRLGKKLTKFRDRELSGITLKIDDSDAHRLRYAFIREDEQPDLQTPQTLQTSSEFRSRKEPEKPIGDATSHAERGKQENACEPCKRGAQDAVSWNLVETEAQLDRLLGNWPEKSEPIALDTETYGFASKNALNPWKGRVRLLQLAWKGGDLHVIDFQKIGKSALLRLLKRVGDHLVVGHNLALDLSFLGLHYGFRSEAVFCTRTASRILSAGDRSVKHNLGTVVERYLGIELEKSHGGSDWSGTLNRDQFAYAAHDVAYLLPLREELKARLEEAGLTRTAQLEMKMVIVAAEMRLNGLRIDRRESDRIGAEAGVDLENQKKKIASIAGPGLNPNSVPQLQEAFRSLGVALPNTKEDALKDCDHELAEALLGYRKSSAVVKKVRELERFIADDGRVHPEFDPMAARTGRFSASTPNVQNLPRGAMRRVIVAGEGCQLISADYSQIEIRVAAVVSGEERMLEAYRKGQDLHEKTASLILGKSIPEVTDEERRLAKAVNFGLLFGQSAKGLVEYAANTYDVYLSEEEAHQFRDAFFRAYPALRAWHERMRREANEDAEEARTLLGRRRQIPAGTKWWPRFTTLINTPVQGTASDGMKQALWELRSRLPESAKLVSMIHDEVIIEVPSDLATTELLALVRQCLVDGMQSMLTTVPIEVEPHFSKSWN